MTAGGGKTLKLLCTLTLAFACVCLATPLTLPAEAGLIGPPVQLMPEPNCNWWPSMSYDANADEYYVMWDQKCPTGHQFTARRFAANTGAQVGADIQLPPTAWSYSGSAAYNSTSHEILAVYPIQETSDRIPCCMVG